MSYNIDIKARLQEGNDCNQPSEVNLEIEVFRGERGKGLKLGDKVLLEPVYDYISESWEWHNGYIFIMKNLNWQYGIVFVSQDLLEVEVFQSTFSSPIRNLKNGQFFCEDGGFFDYRGNPVKR